MPANRSQPRSAVFASAIRSPALRRTLAAYLLFNLSELAIWLAILIWAYDRGGVNAASLLAVAQLVPAAVVAPAAAAWLDRMDHRRALTLGYVLQSLTMFATGAFMLLRAPYFAVAAAAILASCAVTLTRPVHFALLPQFSQTTEQLTAGNGISSMAEGLAAFVGPLASGVITALRGVGTVPVILGFTSLLAAALTAGLGASDPPRAVSPEAVDRGLRGLLEVAREPGALVLTLLTGLKYVVYGMLDILLVGLAIGSLHLSHAGPGFLNSALGVGVVLGGSLAVLRGGRRRMTPLFMFGAALVGLPLMLLANTHLFVLVLFLILLVGAGTSLFDITARTLTQRALPEHLLAPMFGLQESVTMIGLLVGSVLAPALVAGFGLTTAFFVAGGAFLLLIFTAVPRLHRLEQRTKVPEDIYNSLLPVRPLTPLSPRAREQLARYANRMSMRGGEIVVAQGEVGDKFYVVVSGELDVSIDQQHVRSLGPGDWFGEIALLRDVPRTATVTATSDAQLLAIGREPFLWAVTGTPPAHALASEHMAGYGSGPDHSGQSNLD